MMTNPPYQPPPPYGPPTPAQPGPPPAPAFAPPAYPPQGGHPADPPRVTPPPPPGVPTEPVKASPVAALIPVAGLLAVIGAFLAWFRPEASGNGRTIKAEDTLHSWEDGKIGLLPPIVLVVLSVSVIGLLMGKAARGRFSGSADPVKSVAKFAIGAGVGTLVCTAIAWFFVTSQYKAGGESWDEIEAGLKANGYTLSRGPQLGFFLTIAAGVIALIGGVLLLVMSKSPVAAPPAGFSAPPAPGYGPPAGYAPQPGLQPGAYPPPNQPPNQGGYQPSGYQQGAYPPPNQPPSLYKPEN